MGDLSRLLGVKNSKEREKIRKEETNRGGKNDPLLLTREVGELAKNGDVEEDRKSGSTVCGERRARKGGQRGQITTKEDT